MVLIHPIFSLLSFVFFLLSPFFCIYNLFICIFVSSHIFFFFLIFFSFCFPFPLLSSCLLTPQFYDPSISPFLPSFISFIPLPFFFRFLPPPSTFRPFKRVFSIPNSFFSSQILPFLSPYSFVFLLFFHPSPVYLNLFFSIFQFISSFIRHSISFPLSSFSLFCSFLVILSFHIPSFNFFSHLTHVSIFSHFLRFSPSFPHPSSVSLNR